MIGRLEQIPTAEEVTVFDSFIPKNEEGLRIYKDINNPSGIIKQFEIHAVCYVVNEDGHLGLMFCDDHGNSYDTIFGLMLSKFKNFEKNISIDYTTNKISLYDICGNLIIRSDIDPELVVRIANTNLKLEQIHPELMDPEAINKILNSNIVKNSIIKHMTSSSKGMEVKTVS